MKLACLIPSLLLASTGCVVQEGELGSVDQAAMSMNAMSMNAMSMNAMSMNAMSMNAMSMNSFVLDTTTSGGIETTAQGLQVLKYLVRCALPEGQELIVEVGNSSKTFAGLLGLAPDWVSRSLSASEERSISACMLAHVNHFGVSVAVSMRHESLPLSPAEVAEHSVYEATFYGNIFASPMQMYSCQGTPQRLAQSRSSDRKLRVCSDASSADGALSRCTPVGQPDEFLALGPCSEVCSEDQGSLGWTGCSGALVADEVTGADEYRTYETISAWLRAD